jgi:hypothetical protein
MWRGGGRLGMSVSAPFVCLSGSAIAPFPHPSHRTQRLHPLEKRRLVTAHMESRPWPNQDEPRRRALSRQQAEVRHTSTSCHNLTCHRRRVAMQIIASRMLFDTGVADCEAALPPPRGVWGVQDLRYRPTNWLRCGNQRLLKMILFTRKTPLICPKSKTQPALSA